MDQVRFLKMHGLGNDFVVIDARMSPFSLSAAQAAAIADRRRGIGGDQIIVLEAAPGEPNGNQADVFMRIRNADGSASAACGNATRCIGGFLMDESGKSRVVIGSEAGDLFADKAPGGEVTIDFGAPRLAWHEVPLAREMDTLHLPLSIGPVSDPASCSMGNPHATFFVDDVEALDIAAIGPKLEFDPLFPERANIGFGQIVARDRIRMRVWERGAGITQACGTGACAMLVNAVRRGLADRKAQLVLDGGTLTIEWRESDDHVLMTGAVAIAARGVIDPSLLAVS